MNKILSYSFLRFDARKGQQIIAQGNALGLWASREIVRPARSRRGDDIYKSKIHVSDENDGLIFPENEVLQFPASGRLASEGNYLLCSSNSPRLRQAGRTVFLLHPIPRATFRIFPPETMPWAELFRPFRPGLVYKE